VTKMFVPFPNQPLRPRREPPMRRYIFRPYRTGPSFILCTWDAEKRDGMGKNIIRYRLAMREAGVSTVLFAGEDFACAPSDAIDSVATAEALMSFLTLRPGDTDEEYFAKYTQAQLDYCAQHAEALHAEVSARWCDPKDGQLKARYSR
jgi:hypothetical protein